MLFWSPDGAFIGFWAGGKLKKIPAEGGTPLTICEHPPIGWASWSQDNLIIAQRSVFGPGSRISVQSGEVSQGAIWGCPRFLPDGKHLLYHNLDPAIKGLRAYVVDLSTGREMALMPTDTKVIFVPVQPGKSEGHLLFGRGGTLLALRFDAGRLRITGEPIPVAKDVPFFFWLGWSEFDASSDGVLVYSTGSQEASLTWVDRAGRELGPVGLSGDFFGYFRLSPDERKIAADIYDFSSGCIHVWIHDIARSTSERMALDFAWDGNPVWSPDGKSMAFASTDGGPIQLKIKSSNDQRGARQFPPGAFQLCTDWSPDGRWIFYQTTGGEANAEIWLASVETGQLVPLLQTRFDTSTPALSPSGEYLAFSANDTGRSEIYVQRFEGGGRGGASPKLAGERRRVSRDGGIGPRWRRDSKELFFLSPDRHVMAVPADPGKVLGFGPPAALFRLPTSYQSFTPQATGFEVSGGGQKFIVPVRRKLYRKTMKAAFLKLGSLGDSTSR